jgi:hypothetical protein
VLAEKATVLLAGGAGGVAGGVTGGVTGGVAGGVTAGGAVDVVGGAAAVADDEADAGATPVLESEPPPQPASNNAHAVPTHHRPKPAIGIVRIPSLRKESGPPGSGAISYNGGEQRKCLRNGTVASSPCDAARKKILRPVS